MNLKNSPNQSSLKGACIFLRPGCGGIGGILGDRDRQELSIHSVYHLLISSFKVLIHLIEKHLNNV